MKWRIVIGWLRFCLPGGSYEGCPREHASHERHHLHWGLLNRHRRPRFHHEPNLRCRFDSPLGDGVKFLNRKVSLLGWWYFLVNLCDDCWDFPMGDWRLLIVDGGGSDVNPGDWDQVDYDGEIKCYASQSSSVTVRMRWIRFDDYRRLVENGPSRQASTWRWFWSALK